MQGYYEYTSWKANERPENKLVLIVDEHIEIVFRTKLNVHEIDMYLDTIDALILLLYLVQ